MTVEQMSWRLYEMGYDYADVATFCIQQDLESIDAAVVLLYERVLG